MFLNCICLGESQQLEIIKIETIKKILLYAVYFFFFFFSFKKEIYIYLFLIPGCFCSQNVQVWCFWCYAMERICLCFQSWEEITGILALCPPLSLYTDTFSPWKLDYVDNLTRLMHNTIVDAHDASKIKWSSMFSVLLLWIFTFESVLCVSNLTLGHTLQRKNSTFWPLERVNRVKRVKIWCFLWSTLLYVLPNIISPLSLPP